MQLTPFCVFTVSVTCARPWCITTPDHHWQKRLLTNVLKPVCTSNVSFCFSVLCFFLCTWFCLGRYITSKDFFFFFKVLHLFVFLFLLFLYCCFLISVFKERFGVFFSISVSSTLGRIGVTYIIHSDSQCVRACVRREQNFQDCLLGGELQQPWRSIPLHRARSL